MAGVVEERSIARLARAQHGVVTTRQLAEAGFGPRAVRRRRATASCGSPGGSWRVSRSAW